MGQSVLEIFVCGKRNKYHITEHQVGAGRQAGGGSSGVEARERQRWNIEGDKDHKGDPYVLWSGIRRLKDRGREQASGGSRGGLERGSGVTGGRHRQIWPKRGKFLFDIGFAEMVHRRHR